MEIGQRVQARFDLNEDDWWEAEWDLDRDPWCVPQGTEGTIKSFDNLPDFCVVDFDNGVDGVVVCYRSEFTTDDIEIELTASEIAKQKEAEQRKYNDPDMYKHPLL